METITKQNSPRPSLPLSARPASRSSGLAREPPALPRPSSSLPPNMTFSPSHHCLETVFSAILNGLGSQNSTLFLPWGPCTPLTLTRPGPRSSVTCPVLPAPWDPPRALTGRVGPGTALLGPSHLALPASPRPALVSHAAPRQLSISPALISRGSRCLQVCLLENPALTEPH